MNEPIVLYFFQLKNELTGKWFKTRWRMTIAEAKARHGEGNYSVMWETKEVRERTDPEKKGAGIIFRE